MNLTLLLYKFLSNGYRLYLIKLVLNLLAIILNICGFIYNDDYLVLHCIDDAPNLDELKKELDYWQNDLLGLQDVYKIKGYDVLSPDQLTPHQLAEKASLEESIADGRKNVSKSIKDIGNYHMNKIESSSTLGKRDSERSEPQENKKSR